VKSVSSMSDARTFVSDTTVVSPFRPPAQPQLKPKDPVRWANSDNPLRPAPMPKVVTQKVNAQPVRTLPTVQEPPVQESKTRPRLRAALMLAGAFLVIPGLIGGMISMVALGPLGLAVAAGALFVGSALLKAAVNM